MFDLLDQIAPYGIPAQYLLFDSWFSYPKVILKAMERNLHVICMLKAMPKVRYQYMSIWIFLKLAKEFQGRSYYQMVAHTTIVFCRYIMLSLESRSDVDPRTFGNLFYIYCDEMHDINFSQSISLLMELLKDSLQNFLHVSERKVNEFLDQFISSLPASFKGGLKLSTCES